MQDLRDSSRKFDIICFGDHWDDYLRRRQQIARRLSKFEEIDKVIYIELPLTIFSFIKYLLGKSLPKVGQAWRRVLKHGLLCKDNGVYILTPVTVFPDIPVRIVHRINNLITYWLQLLILRLYIKKLNLQNSILWITHPMAADYISKLGERIIFYDRTEDFAYKHDCPATFQNFMKKNDSKIIKRADFIFVQTKEMLKEISAEKQNVFWVPNAVDILWFNNDEASNAPDMREISHPILCYCGNINSRVDFELLRYVVTKHPEWSLVIIGHLASGVNGFSLLKDFKNVHLLGIKPYKELPSYLRKCDVCLIPHKIDKFTESQSPLKLFDYMAAGKPIVSTNIAGVRDYKNIVKIGYTKEDFVFLVEEALANDSKEEIEKRQAIALQNTWEKRTEDIYKILKLHLSKTIT